MIHKNWVGEYAYNYEDDTSHYSFEIIAEWKDGSFEGTVYEQEFSGITNDVVHVKGFVEGDLISFVKTYPYLFGTDEKGLLIIDKGLRGHQVVYGGNFDKNTGIWSGDWEIIMHEEKNKLEPETYKIESMFGPWNMKLKGHI